MHPLECVRSQWGEALLQQEGEVGGGLGGQAVVLKEHVVANGVGRFPAVAEPSGARPSGGDDGVEAGFLRRVQLAQRVPLVGQGVAVEDFELRRASAARRCSG